MSHFTIRDRVLASPDPYQKSIALMGFRDVDHAARTVTFHFEDGSTLVFDIRYEVRP